MPKRSCTTKLFLGMPFHKNMEGNKLAASLRDKSSLSVITWRSLRSHSGVRYALPFLRFARFF